MVFVIDHVMKIIHRGQSELLEHVCYSILINFITEYRPFSLHAIVKWKDNYSTRTRDTSDWFVWYAVIDQLNTSSTLEA